MDAAAILDAIAKSNEKLTAHFDSKLSPVQTDLFEIKNSLASMNLQMTEVQTRVSTNEDDIAILKRKVHSLEKDVTYLKLKAEDAENRSRRSNLRFLHVQQSRGEPRDLSEFVGKLVQQLLGEEAFPVAPVVERAHRSITNSEPQPGFKKPKGPPSILAKFLNFQDKDKILRVAREKETLTYEGKTILIFPDYSKETMARRRRFDDVKSHLRKKRMEYSLLFPARLRVVENGKEVFFDTAPEAEAYFRVPSTAGFARRHLFSPVLKDYSPFGRPMFPPDLSSSTFLKGPAMSVGKSVPSFMTLPPTIGGCSGGPQPAVEQMLCEPSCRPTDDVNGKPLTVNVGGEDLAVEEGDHIAV